MNETVHDYCQATAVVFTRCRPYRKNDQAFVEQKNGAVVRHVVGYRRLEGLEAARALARLYATVRLFVNFFQPSFKLGGAGTVDVGVIAYKRITFDRTGDVIAKKPLPRPCYRRNTSTACSTSTNRSSRPFMISERCASTPRPHIGFGVSKAGAEAQALAEALSNHDDIDRALATYNAARQPLSERVIVHGRTLGCSSASVSRPMKIAGWQNYYKRPRALWIGLR
jgi:hypothetical protein